MPIKTVYQTLEDRFSDSNELEANGPYMCRWDNSWLGDGYYFWDTFIANAHWWGAEIRKYQNGYIICKAICDYDEEKCCDLVGNTDHLNLLRRIFELLKQKGLANSNTKVRRLIHFLKYEAKTFNFEAIRAYGIRSKSYASRFSFNLFFENDRPQYMDMQPAIQICFFNKNSLNLRNYRIVFPDGYAEDYVV